MLFYHVENTQSYENQTQRQKSYNDISFQHEKLYYKTVTLY